MTLIIKALLWIVAGALTGMLVNYLSDVLPHHRRLRSPRCTQCGTVFPLFNYLFFPRRCPACGHRRGWRTWGVEIVTILGFLYIFWGYRGSFPPAWAAFFLSYFILVMVIDIEHRLILHVVSLAGALAALISGGLVHGWATTLIGGGGGFGIMLLLYLAGDVFVKLLRRLQGIHITEEALGFGDVNLSGVVGLLLGWPGVLAGLLLAILLGGLMSLVYLLYRMGTGRYTRQDSLPYGPFLASSALLLMLFKELMI